MQRFHYEKIDSTNLQAQRLAESMPDEVIFVTADVQTAGRGRFGRTWLSPKGGAWMSLVWPTPREVPPAPGSTPPPEIVQADIYAAAPLVAAVATWRTIRHVLGQTDVDLKIKWPNDILLADRKVAGVLCQRVFAADEAGSLIIGVGVNVDVPLERLQGKLNWPPTTLAQHAGFNVDVSTVIERFAQTATEMLTAFQRHGLTKPLLDELTANLAFVGRSVTLSIGHRTLTGVLGGLDDQGRLLLETTDGIVACESGEVKDVHV